MRIVAIVCAAVAAVCCAGPVFAAPPPVPDIAIYGGLPAVEFVELSPSGERIAYVTTVGDTRKVIVTDLAGKLVIAQTVGDTKIRRVAWAGDNYLIVTASQTQNIHLGTLEDIELDHAVAMNLQTQKVITVFNDRRDIMGSVFGYYGAALRDGQWVAYFGGMQIQQTPGFAPKLKDGYPDLYRIYLETGRTEKAAIGGDQVHDWVLGPDGEIAAHARYDQETGQWRLFSGSDKLLNTVTSSLGEVGLAGLGRAPNSVIVAQSKTEEWSTDGAHSVLSPDARIEGFIHDPNNRLLVGLLLPGDRLRQAFSDEALASKAKALQTALGPSATLISWSADRKRVIVSTDHDADPGTFWLIDGAAAKPLAYSHPKIPDAAIGPAKMITWKAADGLDIAGVLTLPPGREAKGLPVVVLPHGGPESQSGLGFDWEAQAFASRGYAVLQPNFRGSSGYGLEFRNAGFNEWGRKMQTDISDGVAALAKDGVIDAKRACIVGGSYGGYAALAGVTVQQGLYKCAVSIAGVANLQAFVEDEGMNSKDDEDNTASSRYWRSYIGPIKGAELRALSPSHLAAKADAPILLIHGEDDTVVRIKHSRDMERALKSAGKPVEFVVLKSEDHWLSREGTRIAMLQAAIAFVQKNNPPG